MQESMYKYMKLGIVHFMAFPDALRGEGAISETIKKIAEDDFFTAIELTWVKDEDEKKKVKDILEASGLTVAFAAQPAVLTIPLNPNSLDEDERKKAVDVLKEQIDNASYFGAVGMAFLSGKDPGADQREAATEALIKTCQELCDYAAAKDLKIVLETFDSEIDKKSLIGPSKAAAELAKAVDRENFGLMIDLSHLPLQGESAIDALSNVKEHLVHAHIGNCLMRDEDHGAYGDYHPRFGIEGGENGVEELAEFLNALFNVGYLGDDKQSIVSFEVKPFGEAETSEMVIANAKRTLREAWAML